MITPDRVPEQILACIERLEASGYESWLVGGAVRDLLLNQTSSDWDVATAAQPAETEAVFEAYRVISIGRAHGTVRVIADDLAVDVTTCRVDGDYLDSRHPEHVTYTSSIREDLSRRDFTINAMAWHPIRGLYDPFGGQDDLIRQTIKAVGNASARLQEDALRIMRALRFSAVLGFSLDEPLRAAIFKHGHLLQKLPAERLGMEWSQLLFGSCAAVIVSRFMPVLQLALPETPNARPFAAWRALSKLQNADVLRHVAFAAAMALDRSWLNTLPLNQPDRQRAMALYALLTSRDLPPVSADTMEWRWLAARVGVEVVSDFLKLQKSLTDAEEPWLFLEEAAETWKKSGFLTVRDLAVNGHKLRIAGVRPRHIGQMQKRLFLAVADGSTANNEAALLETVKLWYNLKDFPATGYADSPAHTQLTGDGGKNGQRNEKTDY